MNKTEKEFHSIKKITITKSIKLESVKKLIKKLFKNGRHIKM